MERYLLTATVRDGTSRFGGKPLGYIPCSR